MPSEFRLGPIQFIPLDANAPKFFGFSEYLAALALMVLAWTTADFRYKFRIQAAFLPLQKITFIVVAVVGVLTLLTDLWRAQEWLVPKGALATPSTWQAYLGGLFLFTFLGWAWFALMRRPVFGKINCKRYAMAIYRSMLKGDARELSVIADELAYSAKALIYHASKSIKKGGPKKSPTASAYANDILRLIADKRFCKAIVSSSPRTLLAFFGELRDAEKFHLPVDTFARNVVNEALNNKDSFLYHEAEGYASGLLGYIKPFSQAMFSNYRMVESIGSLLDIDVWASEKWDAEQWEAYCQIVLIVFKDYVQNDFKNHSYSLYRAKGSIERSVFNLYTLNGSTSSSYHDAEQGKLRVVMDFVEKAIKILEDNKDCQSQIRLKAAKNSTRGNTFFDHLSDLIFEVIFAASAVQKPMMLCWWIQHNSVWDKMFHFDHQNGAAAKILKFKVRRRIYDEIKQMKEFPNFRGAKFLGFCLNVLGLEVSREDHYRDSRPLHKAILSWTKKNYAWLYSYNKRVAEACLVDGYSYEKKRMRIVRTYPANGLRREKECFYFQVDKPLPKTELAPR